MKETTIESNTKKQTTSNNEKGRGSFILLEGCDRSGKTTQAKLLIEALKEKNQKVEFARFPDRTSEIGKVIDQYLKSSSNDRNLRAVHLLFTANRWELMDGFVKKMKEEGVTYVIDRYAYSGIAYSMANGIDKEWCQKMESGLPKPDVVLFLDLSVEDASKRGEYGLERYEKKAFQQKVRDNYHELIEDNWKVLKNNININVIDATQTKEEIAKQLLDISLKTIEESKNKPIQVI
ncbi:deoxythymidylate kinase-like protein [Anaeromyces robustus]|uniref:Thymidylate kinase n=1 Tax=Anaeromyces robustus TaxID=1754192 RepID=A0A1Y1VUJ6_9FUNG|nr:deoxythymidylate kinase-like protein [Anaeromyces robustus]|eukprot:ORX64686.1 deoxythymidylate kinase-like protein [Anaeromyces robustus]